MKIFLFLISISLSFSQVSLNYYIRQDSIYIGDLINYVIELNLSENQVPIFPDLESESEELSISGKVIGDNFVEYEITFWETGQGIIPSIPIQIMENNQVKVALETDSLVVNIYSHLTSNDISVRDIKGMRNVEMLSTLEKILIVIAVILGIITSIILWKKRKSKPIFKTQRKKYIEPIHIQTLKELDNIEIEYPINWENAESYYLKLTFIFRKYLAEEFYFKALEMTTNEILEFFINKNFLDESLTKDIKELLNRADLSKYAMQVPDKDYFISDKDKAITLVKSMHEKLERMTNGH